MGEVGCYHGATKTQEETTMMPDQLEEHLIAFLYATERNENNICPVCGGDLEENEDGGLRCPECGD